MLECRLCFNPYVLGPNLNCRALILSFLFAVGGKQCFLKSMVEHVGLSLQQVQ